MSIANIRAQWNQYSVLLHSSNWRLTIRSKILYNYLFKERQGERERERERGKTILMKELGNSPSKNLRIILALLVLFLFLISQHEQLKVRILARWWWWWLWWWWWWWWWRWWYDDDDISHSCLNIITSYIFWRRM